jgi:hypothetical protein
MKYVMWRDRDGYPHRSILRDNDPDELAPQGIPAEPPDVGQLDWEQVRRDLQGQLMERGLYSVKDIDGHQDALSGAVLSALRTKLIRLYREVEKHADSID